MISGLRSLSSIDLKVLFSKYSAPTPYKFEDGGRVFFHRVVDAVDALIFMNNRYIRATVQPECGVTVQLSVV